MNETKKILTMEFITSIMDENYTLVWVDYRESFDESRDLLQQCLEKQGCEDLWSKVEDWYEDAEEQATQEVIKELKSHCINFHDFEEEEVEAFFEEHDDEIRDEIRERDIPMTKYTVEGLKYTKGMIGMNVDYEKMYKDQEELFRICRENGLEVRMSDPDLPSTLDINLSQADRERIELFKSRVEKDVLIIWDPEEFDRP